MMCLVAVAAFLILVFEKQLEVALAFFTISLVVLAWFVRAWSHEFVFLMGLRDEDLPGRHDKLIWAFLLFVFAPIAIWFFRSYRLAHWPEPVAEPYSSLRRNPRDRRSLSRSDFEGEDIGPSIWVLRHYSPTISRRTCQTGFSSSFGRTHRDVTWRHTS